MPPSSPTPASIFSIEAGSRTQRLLEFIVVAFVTAELVTGVLSAPVLNNFGSIQQHQIPSGDIEGSEASTFQFPYAAITIQRPSVKIAGLNADWLRNIGLAQRNRVGRKAEEVGSMLGLANVEGEGQKSLNHKRNTKNPLSRIWIGPGGYDDDSNALKRVWELGNIHLTRQIIEVSLQPRQEAKIKRSEVAEQNEVEEMEGTNDRNGSEARPETHLDDPEAEAEARKIDSFLEQFVEQFESEKFGKKQAVNSMTTADKVYNQLELMIERKLKNADGSNLHVEESYQLGSNSEPQFIWNPESSNAQIEFRQRYYEPVEEEDAQKLLQKRHLTSPVTIQPYAKLPRRAITEKPANDLLTEHPQLRIELERLKEKLPALPAEDQALLEANPTVLIPKRSLDTSVERSITFSEKARSP